jgi:hypothetical protein
MNFKVMDKRLIAFSMIPLMLMTFVFGNLNKEKNIDSELYSVVGLDLNFNLTYDTLEYENDVVSSGFDNCFLTPKLDKSFTGFKEALAFKESRGNYFSINTFGYLGKYQFGKSTLQLIGVHNTNTFLSNPKLQEKAFLANVARNKWILRRDIKRFCGTYIEGVLITESGILAAAHLAGPGSVKKYLRSYGAIGFADAYGTTIKKYMNNFSGYDTSFVVGNRKAKANLM